MDVVANLKEQLKETHNLAGKFDQETLDKLGQEVVNNYDVDKGAMSQWEDQVRDALKLAKQVKEDKSTPWEDAANVKFPLMTVAAIQFASRAYPEIVKGKEIVQVDITGKDPDNSKRLRGSRVECHMNYQLTKEMEEWEPDTDQLLHMLPVIGMVWRKTYRDGNKKRNVSELIMPDDCTINQKARTEDTARRITHRCWLYNNDIWERQAAGVWVEFQEQKDGNKEIPEACLDPIS